MQYRSATITDPPPLPPPGSHLSEQDGHGDHHEYDGNQHVQVEGAADEPEAVRLADVDQREVANLRNDAKQNQGRGKRNRRSVQTRVLYVIHKTY